MKRPSPRDVPLQYMEGLHKVIFTNTNRGHGKGGRPTAWCRVQYETGGVLKDIEEGNQSISTTDPDPGLIIYPKWGNQQPP